jgi:hypothetical protein
VAEKAPFGASCVDRDVFGETPKTAVETTALPETAAYVQ